VTTMLGDLGADRRRSRTDGQGIVNLSLGLARARSHVRRSADHLVMIANPGGVAEALADSVLR